MLLDDGLLELEVTEVTGGIVRCRVVEGGVLKSRKGVNFQNLALRLPSLTEKDIRDVEFGVAQGVDWISLSFVRSAADVDAEGTPHGQGRGNADRRQDREAASGR